MYRNYEQKKKKNGYTFFLPPFDVDVYGFVEIHHLNKCVEVVFLFCLGLIENDELQQNICIQ